MHRKGHYLDTNSFADGHDDVREGLRAHLEAQPHFEVVAEAADGKEAILKGTETKPDVLVLAYELPFWTVPR